MSNLASSGSWYGNLDSIARILTMKLSASSSPCSDENTSRKTLCAGRGTPYIARNLLRASGHEDTSFRTPLHHMAASPSMSIGSPRNAISSETHAHSLYTSTESINASTASGSRATPSKRAVHLAMLLVGVGDGDTIGVVNFDPLPKPCDAHRDSTSCRFASACDFEKAARSEDS
uniref:Uncharacterized protein n=1 Tax=Bombyx mori TaxID=7091 RepID=A0A8R2LUR1_BOMMO|nr:uncharacterized protein LOC119628452 [Bombyx mori]